MFRIYHPFLIAAAVWLAAACCQAQTYTISTFAGQGLALGNGGPAANGLFGVISAVAMGPDGSIYIADSAFNQVRKIGLDGSISLFAGSQVGGGYSGDGGPATAAMLNNPTALIVDSGGQVYIGDSGNHRVRIVNTYGNISTFAGNGQVPPSPAASPLYPGGGGAATSAALNTIAGLGFASNSDLLIADSGNNRIFRVNESGNISAVAGNATTPASLSTQPALSATLNGPSGVVCDYLGDIYFSEQGADVMREIDPTGNMTVVAGTGSASGPVAAAAPLSYSLLQPAGLTADSNYNIYIVESGRVSMFIPGSAANGNPNMIQAIAGDITQKVTSGTGDGGAPLSAGMNPRSVVVDPLGDIYIADSILTPAFSNRLRVIAANSIGGPGTIVTLAGGQPPGNQGDNGPATSAQLNFPRAVAIDPKGSVYIADTANNRVRAVNTTGNINTFAGAGTAGTSGDQGPALQASLNPPTGIAEDSAGNIYIDDGARIRQVNGAGIISTFAGGGSSTQEGAAALSAMLTQAGSLAVDAQNDIYVDQLARVSEVSAGSQTMHTVAGNGTAGYAGDNGPAAMAQVATAAGVAVDAGGNLYIADAANGRIRKVDSTGNITTIAGGGTSTSNGVMATSAALNMPLGVAVDVSGNVYIAEYGGNRVRMVNPAGAISTIAGNGVAGFTGDGGLANNASLNGPADVKVDSQGNVYITDSRNSSIRKLTPSAAPVPSITAIAGAASLAGGPVAPGERVLLTGAALGPNCTVMFDNTAAPVLFSSFKSALVVVPYQVAGESTSQVTVTTAGAVSASFAAQIAPSAPGIYTTAGNGQGQAFAFNNDGTLNSPGNPALAGTPINIVYTGDGVVTPAVATGALISQTPPSPVLPLAATLDGNSIPVNQAFSLPGTIGESVMSLNIPQSANSESTASLQISVGNASSQFVSVAVVSQSDDSGDSGDNSGDNSGDGSDLRSHQRATR